jgi:hypothetical protein
MATATEEMELTLPADAALAISARVFVAAAARRHGVDEEDVRDLTLAVSELFRNAVETRRPSLQVRVRRDADIAVITVLGAGPVERATPLTDLDGRAAGYSLRDLLSGLFDAIVFDEAGEGRAEITVAAGVAGPPE